MSKTGRTARALATAAALMWAANAGAGSALLRDLAAGLPRTVVVYGTSLTAGGPWVGQMQNWITNVYAGRLTLVNSGLSGKNSGDGVTNLASKVLAYHPDTVFLEFSVNDAFTNFAISLAQSRSNLDVMVNAILAQNPRAEIILQTMNSAWDSSNNTNQSASKRPFLADYYQVYRDTAAERGLLLIDHYPHWAALQTNDSALFQAYIPDGVHPGAAGTKAVILPELKRRLIGEVARLPAVPPAPQLVEADVAVYGGTSAGVAAAVQAARMGRRVALLAPEARLGGLSSGGLGQTDIGSPDAIGGIAREFHRRIYYHYLDADAWTIETRSNYVARSSRDPDDARRMMFTFEPEVARRQFEDFVAEAGVTVVPGRLDRTGGVRKTGTTITEIATTGGAYHVRAGMYIDATYEGDLLAAAGVTYTVGREPNSRYGETLNGIQTARATKNQPVAGIDPYVVSGQPASGLLPGVNPDAGGADGEGDARIQAYNFRMCLTDVASNRTPVTQPTGYQEADYELLFRATAAGQASAFFSLSSMPNRKTDSNNSGGISTDFIGGNYSLTGGWNYAEADDGLRAQIVDAHRRYQQGFVWTLQNHPRIPAAVRSTWSGWGLPLDEFDDTGHWAPQLYVREARRMVSDVVITERHVDQEVGFVFADPVGMGGYNMDSHNVQRHVGAAGTVTNEGDIQVAPARGPYGISYRALTPRSNECANLLAAVAVSATHIAFGSVRMEPVFMILGQSAAAAAALALDAGVPVQRVEYARLRAELLARGQVLSLAGGGDTGGIILDDAQASGVELVGEWTASTAVTGYYGSAYIHDGDTNKGQKRVVFRPTLPASNTYEVAVRWPAHSNRGTNVPVDVIHAGGTNTVRVNQRLSNNTWVVLGSYIMRAGTSAAVVVRNGDSSGFVVADAVRFLPPGWKPPVSVHASALRTAETGGPPGAVMVVREGATNGDLVVALSVGGSAAPNVDYVSLPATVTIPAGAAAASVAVAGFLDGEAEGDETVTVALAAGADYSIGTPATATVVLADTPYDGWRHAHFTAGELASPAVSGDYADPDGDRMVNRLEYALGTNPRLDQGRAGLPEPWLAAGAGGPEFRLRYAKAAPEMIYEVEWTPVADTVPWSTAGITPEHYLPTSGLFFRALPAAVPFASCRLVARGQ